MVDHAARKLGCAVIPAGTGQTEQQIELIRALRPDAYVGTPSFLRIIIEKAQRTGLDISNLKRALLAAEALPASLRQWFQEQGVETVLQWYGTADLGCIAYESEALEGMILEEDLLLEIVRPGTGEPVPDGEVGEIVVTSFNPHYPMIRFGTGDLSAVHGGHVAVRPDQRADPWLAGARRPGHQGARACSCIRSRWPPRSRRHPEVRRARLVVSGEMANDRMTLLCEVPGRRRRSSPPADLADAIGAEHREATKLRAEVRLVPPAACRTTARSSRTPASWTEPVCDASWLPEVDLTEARSPAQVPALLRDRRRRSAGRRSGCRPSSAARIRAPPRAIPSAGASPRRPAIASRVAESPTRSRRLRHLPEASTVPSRRSTRLIRAE